MLGTPVADLVPFRTSLQVPGTGVGGTMPNQEVWRLSNLDSVLVISNLGRETVKFHPSAFAFVLRL
jgi:hypothetical protein